MVAIVINQERKIPHAQAQRTQMHKYTKATLKTKAATTPTKITKTRVFSHMNRVSSSLYSESRHHIFVDMWDSLFEDSNREWRRMNLEDKKRQHMNEARQFVTGCSSVVQVEERRRRNVCFLLLCLLFLTCTSNHAPMHMVKSLASFRCLYSCRLSLSFSIICSGSLRTHIDRTLFKVPDRVPRYGGTAERLLPWHIALVLQVSVIEDVALMLLRRSTKVIHFDADM